MEGGERGRGEMVEGTEGRASLVIWRDREETFGSRLRVMGK